MSIRTMVERNYCRWRLLFLLLEMERLMKNVLVVTGSLRTILIELITWSIHFTWHHPVMYEHIFFKDKDVYL